VEGLFVFRKTAPVGIGLFDDDLALVQQPFEGLLNIEFKRLLLHKTEGEILKVDKDRQCSLFFGGYHVLHLTMF